MARKMGGPRTKEGYHIFSDWRRIMRDAGAVQFVGMEKARNPRSLCSAAPAAV